jgi:hypothetical protein
MSGQLPPGSVHQLHVMVRLGPVITLQTVATAFPSSIPIIISSPRKNHQDLLKVLT